MQISQLVDKAYQYAQLKGFHDADSKITFGDRIALIHSEVSEALEAFRDRADFSHYYGDPSPGFSVPKPEGVPSELADVVIRVADLCGIYGIDLEKAVEEKLKFNLTRPYRHGKAAL